MDAAGNRMVKQISHIETAIRRKQIEYSPKCYARGLSTRSANEMTDGRHRVRGRKGSMHCSLSAIVIWL
jgi:hypothetical protein